VTDLSNIPIQELKKEISRREEERLAAKAASLRQHQEIVLKNVQALLDLLPEHDRTSCSDSAPSNKKRCRRCSFLFIKNEGWVPDDLRVSISTEKDSL